MFCPSCGVKNDGSPLKCFICGFILPSGERIPSQGRDSRRYKTPATVSSDPFAAIGDRMLALILDRVVIISLLAIPAAAMAQHWRQLDTRLTSPTRAIVLGSIVLLLAVLAYHIVLEALFGATIGKGLLGLQVRNGTDRMSWLASATRNVMRLVDSFLFYAIAFVVAVFSPRRQRLGDHIAGTTVVTQRVAVGARIALMLIWVVLVAGSLWVASFFCPACVPAGLPFR